MNTLRRRRWLNLGLLGLAGGLAGLAWFTPDRESVTGPPLLNLAPALLERIRVERPGQQTLAFERRGEHWQMTAPGVGPANPVLINPILQLVEMHCPVRYPVGMVDLKTLHLDPPRLRLWLNDQEIRFGSTAPTDDRRYLHLADHVYLCPDRLYPLLSSSAAGFLAPVIEPLPPKAKSSD
ncbi:MAG: hypothetical protein EKK68_04370 [Candidatus Competibacteraceae bacterium]|nr:MAG: hypothetical protein EKK68_04370 [Candidatus Competibacteraceae bacterium]